MAAVGLAASAPVWAQGKPATSRPLIAAPASWVSEAPIRPPPPDAQGDTVDLLSDTQTRLSDDGDTIYQALAFRIATSQGLAAAALQLSWDPSLETLVLHRYRILRGGKSIDLLGDGSRLTVVQRETQMESAALDGRLTVSFQPEDVRVGDVIDVASSLTRRDPAMAGNSEMLTGPQDGSSYGRYRLRVLWPASKPMRWRATAGVLQPKLIRSPEGSELLADLSNVTTPSPPSGAPSRFRLINTVEATQFADWAAVSRTLAPLYQAAQTLAPGSAVKQQAARIAAATRDPRERAERALQLVEEQVRYLFLGMDGGGYVPASADLTWSRRFGDCKAKTVLLVALLRELGIDARPVLVSTEQGDMVAERLPAVEIFDHVIVEARLAGRSYWLDGTRLGDTRFDRLRTPNYGSGLPIVPEGTGLVPLIAEPLDRPGEVLSLSLDASQGIEAPARASGEIRFHGDSVAESRAKYAGLSRTDRERVMRELWRHIYDFVSPDEVAVQEDASTGDLLLTMRGTAKMDWPKGSDARWYELDRARADLTFETARDGELNGDAPFAFEYPSWSASREVIILPDKGRGFTLDGGAIDRTIGDFYHFQRKLSLEGGVVRMEVQTQVLKPELPAADAVRTRDQLAELAQAGAFIRVPDDYEHTDADMAAIKSDPAAAAQAYVQRGAVHLDRRELDASLADAAAALAIDPDLVAAHAVKALALAMKGDPEGGVEADRALAHDQGLWFAWKAKGLLALRNGNYADAVTFLSRELALNEGDANALFGRATAQYLLGHRSEALSDIDKGREIAPHFPIAAFRAEVLSSLGREEEALAEADRAVAAEPGNPALRRSRAGIRARLGRNAEARADLDFLIAHEPQAEDLLSRAELWPAAEQARRRADINAALTLAPRSQQALLMRANAAITAGNFAQAEADLAAVERVDRDTPGLAIARMDLLAKQDKLDAALAVADAAVESHPQDAEPLDLRCWFKAARNVKLATAIADCDAALQLAPDNPTYLNNRGLARLRLGDIDGAITDYSAALKLDPVLPASLYGRGIAYARRGDDNRAIIDLARARSLYPDIESQFADYGIVPPENLRAIGKSQFMAH